MDIIVCVFNALDDVKNCLTSLEAARYGSTDIRIIVVDDASEYKTNQFLLDWTKNREHAVLIRKEKNEGYTKACNSGIAASNAEYIVFLNSDTIVPKMFTRKILDNFRASATIGAVGALSNAASFQSVPDVVDTTGKFAVNELPKNTSVDRMDEICEKISETASTPIYLPILNGFCFAVARRAIDVVGVFDDVNFPVGYGEENDLCFRITDAGFRLRLAQDLYVFHAKSKSFGSSGRSILAASGTKKLKEKYSAERLSRASETLKNNPELINLRARVREIIAKDKTT